MKRPLLLLGAILLALVIYLNISKPENSETLVSAQQSSSPPVHQQPASQTVKSKTYKLIEEKKKTLSSSPSVGSDVTPSQNKFYEAIQSWGKDNAKTKQLLKEAVELNPANVDALGKLAGIYLNENYKEEARAVAIDCLAIDPKNDECNTTLISSFTRFGEFDEAYNYLADCLSVTPNNISCLNGMETYYLKEKRLGDAKNILDQLENLDPNSMWTDLAAGGYYVLAGDRAEAKAHYESACKKGQAYACKMANQISQ